MREHVTVYDNTRVKAGRGYNEYLGLSCAPKDETRTFETYIYRYCVPGRCDSYAFRLNGRVLEFSSDGWVPLDHAIRWVQDDLNKPEVVEMFVNAFSAMRPFLYFNRDIMSLLGLIGPKSKTYRAMKRLQKKMIAENRARIEAKANEKVDELATTTD